MRVRRMRWGLALPAPLIHVLPDNGCDPTRCRGGPDRQPLDVGPLRPSAATSGPFELWVAAWWPGSARERPVAEADATGIVVGREAGGGPADGVETRDATTLAVERGASRIGDDPPSVKVA